jgi:hypothetical protein
MLEPPPEIPAFVKRTVVIEQAIRQARHLDYAELDDQERLDEEFARFKPACCFCDTPVGEDTAARCWIHLEGKIVFLCVDCLAAGIGVMHDDAGDVIPFNPRPELERPSVEVGQAARHLRQARGNIELACAAIGDNRIHLLEQLGPTLDFLEGTANVLAGNLRESGR